MNTMDETFEIKLLIGGIYYPLTIKRQDEVMYREAARRINSLLNRYRDHFPQLSDEKYYVMASLHIAMTNLMWENFNDTLPFKERIEELTKQIDNVLANEDVTESGQD